MHKCVCSYIHIPFLSLDISYVHVHIHTNTDMYTRIHKQLHAYRHINTHF